MAVLSLIFGILGNIISIGLFLSPVPTFRRILREKSTQEFSWLPYPTMLMNCLLWVWYGLPWVVMNIPVLTINTAGSILQLTYVLIFLRFTTSKKKLRISITLATIAVFVAVVVGITLGVLHGESKRKLFVGILCVIFTTGMNVAPLSVMRMVIQTKSVEYMPFFLSLFVFINGCAWLLYGLLTADIFVLIPNALGTLLGAVQLILYVVYKRATPKSGAIEEKPNKPSDSENRLDSNKSGNLNSEKSVELTDKQQPNPKLNGPVSGADNMV